MSVREALRMAIQGVLANRMRSLLTMLGITIGVASVIILVAVGHGSAVAVQSRIEDLGTNTLTISPGGFGIFGGGGAQRGGRELRCGDAHHEGRQGARGRLRGPGRQVGDAGRERPVGLDHLQRHELQPELVHRHDALVRGGAQVADPGRDVLHHAGRGRPQPGDRARADRGAEPVRRGESAWPDGQGQRRTASWSRACSPTKGTNGIQDQDDIAIAPLSTTQDLITGVSSGLSQIVVEAKSTGAVDAAEAEATSILTPNHSSGGSATFRVLNQASLLQTTASTNAHLHRAARGGRRDLAARRRDRGDEHHARHRHRAHPRDRHPQGDRGPQRRHPRPVPDRGRAALGARRRARCRGRPHRQPVQDRRRAAGGRGRTRCCSPSASAPPSVSSSASTPPIAPPRCGPSKPFVTSRRSR